jgi:hypothetical protein
MSQIGRVTFLTRDSPKTHGNHIAIHAGRVYITPQRPTELMGHIPDRVCGVMDLLALLLGLLLLPPVSPGRSWS